MRYVVKKIEDGYTRENQWTIWDLYENEEVSPTERYDRKKDATVVLKEYYSNEEYLGNTTKEEVFCRDVIFPVFGEASDPYGSDVLNVPKLFEKAIAEKANLKWVGDKNLEWDFDLLKSSASPLAMASSKFYYRADAKTSMVKISANGFKGKISSVQAKKGALLVGVYNQYKNKGQGCVDFFVIPYKNINGVASAADKKGRRAIDFTWTAETDNYNTIEQFRCKNFEELCNQK